MQSHVYVQEVKTKGGEVGVVGGEEEWGEPVERCMHCFQDFPLRVMVEHSSRCRGDALGERDRFQNFIPSVHDVSPIPTGKALLMTPYHFTIKAA